MRTDGQMDVQSISPTAAEGDGLSGCTSTQDTGGETHGTSAESARRAARTRHGWLGWGRYSSRRIACPARGHVRRRSIWSLRGTTRTCHLLQRELLEPWGRSAGADDEEDATNGEEHAANEDGHIERGRHGGQAVAVAG